MPYEGNCNCANIQVILERQPPETILCHCHNCRRAGGPSSVNYVVDRDDVQIIDQHTSLVKYVDTNTMSGNAVTRGFCGTCGSPILTETPQRPNKAIIKASLFDSMSAPALEVFTARKESWVKPVDGTKQQ